MVTIRPAQPSDADALFGLASVFATSFAVQRPALDTALAALLKSQEAHLTVAHHGEHLAGYVLGFDHPTFYANGRVAWVEELMVAEQMRRQGVGRLLMNCFEDWARSRGDKLVALATRRAASFYRSIGYEESATYFRKLL